MNESWLVPASSAPSVRPFYFYSIASAMRACLPLARKIDRSFSLARHLILKLLMQVDDYQSWLACSALQRDLATLLYAPK
jgi:hypothetical protein